MKKIFTLIALFVSLTTFANIIIVKGYVKDSTGKAIANRYVRISTDTVAASNTCVVAHYKITDANGFYIDTVTCSGTDIRKLLVSTESCNNILTKTLVITSTLIECNFIICAPPVVTPPPPPVVSFVIVKGNVKDSSGKVIANHLVKIFTDSTLSSSCTISHSKYTNANGYYIDTLYCNTAIKYLSVSSEVCGRMVTNKVAITNGVAESNFIICVPPVVTPPTPVVSVVIVKGYVKDSSGKVIINHLVKTYTDSTFGSSCTVTHAKYTNANGYYIDTLYCNTAIKYLSVSTEGCGRVITNKVAVINGLAESNFIVCMPPVVTPPTPVVTFVIVKGYVKDSSGKVIINHLVKTYTDSTFGSSCTVTHAKYTNANGYYIDTLYCNTAIKYLSVSTEGCGRVITNKVAVTNGIAESNFIICSSVTVTPPTVPACTAYFVYTQQLVGVKFNSNVSVIGLHDTIISRKWSFGDGDSAYNLVDPIHVYRKTGTYNACLIIKTAKGCESKICKTITLNDSLPNAAGSILEPVKIVILYPNPAHEKMNVVLWNFNTSTAAELSIVDIYGQRKWSSKTNLLKGNTSIDVNVSFLANGPYFFKVTTPFGVVSRRFYKL